MKKLLSLSLVLVLLLSTLAGCNLANMMSPKEITCGELTLTVPGTYIDLKGTVNREGIALLYGFNDTAVMGIMEPISDVKAVSPQTFTAKHYAELFVEVNDLDVEVTEKDGLPTFTYTATNGEDSFTYLCATYASNSNFWVLQAYCYTKNFEKNQEDLWEILTSVKI